MQRVVCTLVELDLYFASRYPEGGEGGEETYFTRSSNVVSAC